MAKDEVNTSCLDQAVGSTIFDVINLNNPGDAALEAAAQNGLLNEFLWVTGEILIGF